MPKTHVAGNGNGHRKFSSSTPQAGETFTITCYTCGMPSSTEWAQRVSTKANPSSLDKPYFPFIAHLTPPNGAILQEDGSTFLCAFCNASIESQWINYEKSPNQVIPKDRQYNSHNFTCAVCCVVTYRKRVRALPFQEFPFLIKERQPGSITLGDNPLAVVCLDCSETLWAQSAEYDRWGLPIQKRHFNWMARPPPPEDSMEATVARLPSGETQLPRCSPIVHPRVAIDPRKLNHLTSPAQTVKAKPKSNKVELAKREHKPDNASLAMLGRKFSAPTLSIPNASSECSILPTQPPVVTVAPMSSHINSSSIRKGTSSVPPSLISASTLPKLYPVTTSGLQSYPPSQAPPALSSVRQPSQPLYPTPTYTPFGWARRDIEEHFPYAPSSLQPTRTNSVWNWLAPQQSSDLLRYQSYLSSLENRNSYSVQDAIFNGINQYSSASINNSQPLNAPSLTPHPSCFLPPPFLPTEFGASNPSTSPIHAQSPPGVPTYDRYEDNLVNHQSKIEHSSSNSAQQSSAHSSGTCNRKYNNDNSISSQEAFNINIQNQSRNNQNVSPKRGADPGEVTAINRFQELPARGSNKRDLHFRRSSETEIHMRTRDPVSSVQVIQPKPVVSNEKEKDKCQNSNRKILPKKRKYHFEGEEGISKRQDVFLEPTDFSNSETSESERERKDSSSISASEAELDIRSAALPVDLSIPSIVKNEIPPNFKIAYLSNQNTIESGSGDKDSSDGECKNRNSSRNSVIVSIVQNGSDLLPSTSPKKNDKEVKIICPLTTLMYDNEIQVLKSKPPSENKETLRGKVEFDEKVSALSKSPIGNQITGGIENKTSGTESISSHNHLDSCVRKAKEKSEQEIEGFVQETLKVFKYKERLRIILREREVQRKLEFLKNLDLITLQDKSEIELRKLISRFERNTLPPLKFRPESPSERLSTGDKEFEKQIVKVALEDPSFKQTTTDLEQLKFLNSLRLKPASRAEKYRREQSWKLFLLERKLREKRKFEARGLKKVWDNGKGMNLDKLILESGKLSSRRTSNSSGKLSVKSAPSGSINDYSQYHDNFESSKILASSLTNANGNGFKKSIINYPKYIPSYYTIDPEENKRRFWAGAPSEASTGKQQNTDCKTIHKSVLNMPSFPTSTSSVTSSTGTEVGIRISSTTASQNQNQIRALQPICIPKVPVFNSVASRKRLETEYMETNVKKEYSVTEINGISEEENNEVGTNSDFFFPNPNCVTEVEGDTVQVKVTEEKQPNGLNQLLPRVDPIIRGYNEFWGKTKRDIQDVLISANKVKPDNRSRRLAVCELKRLRKTLISHQSEMKILERKLKTGEKEIQQELIGQNTHGRLG